MKLVVGGVTVVVMAALVDLILAIPVYFLWNWLIPVLLKGVVSNITFWQSWGILFLCSLLFQSSATHTCKHKEETEKKTLV